MPERNRAIIVLGMHRSGTSAFTGVLGLLGVDLGSRLLPASATNQAGYWEHQDIVNTHDELLLALGSSWDNPAPLREGWAESETIAPYRARLLEILRRDFAGSPLWALKDPRLCRLLPLWKSLLAEAGIEPTWFLIERHPFEIVRSLESRDGIPRVRSELLWLRYTLDAERDTRAANRVIMTMDQLLDNWQDAMLRAERAIGREWPTPAARADERVRGFLDPGKRHHRAPETASLSAWTRDAHAGLEAGAAGDEAKLRELLDPVHAAFDTAAALYWPFLQGRAADVERSLAEMNQRYGEAFGSSEKFKEKHIESKERLAARTVELKGHKEKLAAFEKSPGGKLNKLLGRIKPGKTGGIAPVDFPKVESPDVSIIVTLHGDLAATRACLLALRENTPSLKFEVVVVADEDAAASLRSWKHIRIIPAEFAGFGEAHNRAARHARAEEIIFLSATAIAKPGWADALLEALRSTPGAGAVGAQGGDLSLDGAVNFIQPDPSAGLREVDFCTTACLAIAKNLFFQLGGFERGEQPVEEVNLGFKLNRAGHPVYLQPRCPIALPRPAAGDKRLESVRPKLRRWAETLHPA